MGCKPRAAARIGRAAALSTGRVPHAARCALPERIHRDTLCSCSPFSKPKPSPSGWPSCAIRGPRPASLPGCRWRSLAIWAMPVGDGISEMRVDVGLGYRLYFARRRELIILLLCGGDKSTQALDITRSRAWIGSRRCGPRPSGRWSRRGRSSSRSSNERDLAEIQSPDYPGERLIVCKNPLMAVRRAT